MGTTAHYEFFDHTADVGIRATGSTLDAVFEQAARGLVELIAEQSRFEPAEARSIELHAVDTSVLLATWLRELLFWSATDRFLPAVYQIHVTPTTLVGTVRGERFDPARHQQGREVKAITRHQLEIRQTPSGWHAQVIVDI